MTNSLLLLAISLLLAFGQVSEGATSWNGALLAYQRKAQSLQATERAREALEELHAQGTSQASTFRAAELLARLDIFEAQSFHPANSSTRRTRLQSCWQDTVARFESAGPAGVEAGAYWKGMCLALWAETYSGLARLNIVGTMRSELLPVVDRLAQVDSLYGGGGARRILAGFHGSRDSERLRNGSFDSDLAMREVGEALALTERTGGIFHYLNMAVQALVLTDSGDRQASRQVLTDLIARAEEEVAGIDADPMTKDEVKVLIDEARMRLDRR